MLKSYLTQPPYQKFIIIQDTLTENGKPIFDYLLQHNLERFDNKIHYYLVQGNEKHCPQNPKITVHNLKINSQNWDTDNRINITQIAEGLQKRDIIFVDSLAHCIFQYGLAETYRLFNMLKNEIGVAQIVALLHLDLLDSKWKTVELFNFLSTLSMKVQPKFSSEHGRIQYQCKKSGGRVVKQIEEYYFQNGKLETKKIEKLDPKKLLENASRPEINPDDLATFKISLTDKEEESRSQLVLPYLPKDENSSTEGGQIFYKFDEQDDWDEEDPDDDLDI
ncbi:unnamed protein product [Acanthoscelides obtectus]|uniref:Elongator complex protein 5 n=1 Tax=Acanthoscelides obtectus TaxID=200917 RepID=A0A9P0KSJ2_ACAOB|nr:unnamed protein product [Acanthoscelides obtectus]CAK1659091.1 hypothetical protein AOBTE_LOCUS21273 [Acanthoscelides obtectus]